jgi:hypothetical protein
MCDYSLENVASRPAAVADRLIVTSFKNAITRGFAAIGDLDTAVCVRPGTELAFDSDIRYGHRITRWPVRAETRVARFRQIDVHNPYTHHDALELGDGTIVPLARLVPGQWATVLQLPAEPLPMPESEGAVTASELLEQPGTGIKT